MLQKLVTLQHPTVCHPKVTSSLLHQGKSMPNRLVSRHNEGRAMFNAAITAATSPGSFPNILDEGLHLNRIARCTGPLPCLGPQLEIQNKTQSHE